MSAYGVKQTFLRGNFGHNDVLLLFWYLYIHLFKCSFLEYTYSNSYYENSCNKEEGNENDSNA